jgi:hypothetical protein
VRAKGDWESAISRQRTHTNPFTVVFYGSKIFAAKGAILRKRSANPFV